MKILYASTTPTRGIAEKFVRAVNEYTEHEARGLISRSFFDRERSRFDPPLYQIGDPALRDACLDWADVVHLIHETSPASLGRRDILGKKPVFYQRFTLIDKGRWYLKIWPEEDLARVRLLLVAEGWQRYSLWKDKTYKMLPAIFPIDDPSHTPIPVAKRKHVVTFATMNAKDGPPAPKGLLKTKRELEGLGLDLIFRVPFEECMRRKAASWVGIDEVVTPILHFSAFEYLSLGVPCLSWYDEISMQTVLEATGASYLPILNTDLSDLFSATSSVLLKDDAWMEEKSVELRRWMEKYMHPRKVIEQYVELYKEAS